jgi:hypothetical protein
MSFEISSMENETGLIHFTRPRGFYDEVHIQCSPQDYQCWRNRQNLSNTINYNESYTSFSISPIIRGVKYACQASTIKDGFKNSKPSEYSFYTGELL